MEIFYWKLDKKQKFKRSLWFGLVAVIFLAAAVILKVEDLTNKILFITFGIIVYILDIFLKYKKMKS